jgi:hypothetical protein
MFRTQLVGLLLISALWTTRAQTEPPDKPHSASQTTELLAQQEELIVLWEFDAGG